MKVHRTDAAEGHLEGIYAYLAQDSPEFASRMVDRITRRSQQISEFPFSGRSVPEYDIDLVRELIECPYLINFILYQKVRSTSFHNLTDPPLCNRVCTSGSGCERRARCCWYRGFCAGGLRAVPMERERGIRRQAASELQHPREKVRFTPKADQRGFDFFKQGVVYSWAIPHFPCGIARNGD